MVMLLRKARFWLRLWRQLAEDLRGVSAVEFAMVAPVLITILSGIINFGLLFSAQNNMTSISQETARLVAVGEMTTVEGKAYIDDRLMLPKERYTVSVNQVGSDVVVNVTLPYDQVALFDFLGLFDSGAISGQAKMRIL